MPTQGKLYQEHLARARAEMPGAPEAQVRAAADAALAGDPSRPGSGGKAQPQVPPQVLGQMLMAGDSGPGMTQDRASLTMGGGGRPVGYRSPDMDPNAPVLERLKQAFGMGGKRPPRGGGGAGNFDY